jgi:predicted DNA-binding transcriptional regulator AlpA
VSHVEKNMKAARTRFNVSEAASLLRVSKSWLDKKRLDGGGPEFHKFGRRVVYDQRDLDSWAARNKRRHTSEVLMHKS